MVPALVTRDSNGLAAGRRANARAPGLLAVTVTGAYPVSGIVCG